MSRGKKGTQDLELSPQVALDIEKALKVGMTQRDAALFAGVSEASFYKWLQVGKEKPPGHPLRKFAEAVAKAQSSAKFHAVGRVAAGMAKDWKAAAWWLGVTDPKQYGPKVRVTLEAEFEGALERLRSVLPPEMYEKALDALVRGGSEEGAGEDFPGALGPRDP